MRKNMKFWPLNPYYKRSDWKTWLAERFSEALTSKLWNKKNTCCQSLRRNGAKLIIFTSYGFIKNLQWSIKETTAWKSQEKIKSAIPQEQNCTAWLVKNGKTAFSKLTWKISLSVSGKQANKHLVSSFPFSDF